MNIIRFNCELVNDVIKESPLFYTTKDMKSVVSQTFNYRYRSKRCVCVCVCPAAT